MQENDGAKDRQDGGRIGGGGSAIRRPMFNAFGCSPAQYL